jgi:hypothetical protein
LKNSLSNVLRMQGVHYDWKVDEFPEQQFNDQTQLGFIAQEVEQLYPELVITGSDGYKSVDYAKVAPILVEAIKELKLENDQMKKENDQFKNTLTSIQSKLAIIEANMATMSLNSVTTQK